jgi:dephospho-CoA kinase
MKRLLPLRLPKGVLAVGLTGGIASGQSTALRMFEKLGARVLEADTVAHALTRKNAAGWRAVVRAFGKGVLSPNGEIDRRKLGALVFKNPKARKKLEAILHPLILAEERKTLRRWAKKDGKGIYVVNAALMFEAGSHVLYDAIVCVHAPQEIRIRRIMKRDGLSRAEAMRRIRAQMPLREKCRRADFTVDNSGPLARTERRVKEVWGELTRRAAASP